MKAMNIVGAVLFALLSNLAVAQDSPQGQNADSSTQAEQPKRNFFGRLLHRGEQPAEEAKAEEPKAETVEPTAQGEQPQKGRFKTLMGKIGLEKPVEGIHNLGRKALHRGSNDKAGMEPVTVEGSAEAYAYITRKGDGKNWRCASAMLPRGTQDGETMVNTTMFANCELMSTHIVGIAVDVKVIFMVRGQILIVLKPDGTVLTCTATAEDQADAAKQPNTSYQREATAQDLAARGCKEMPKPRPAGRPVAQ